MYLMPNMSAANTCVIAYCENKHKALGLCARHYRRLMRHGKTDYESRSYGTAEERFQQARVRVTQDGCWEWVDITASLLDVRQS